MGWMWGPPVEGYVNSTAEMMNIKPEDLVKEITKDIPLGIIPDDRDCANAVLFLACEESSYFTGQTLFPNGGMNVS